EGGAFTGYAAALYPDATAHRLHQHPAHVQAHTCATHRASDVALEAHEPVEELGDVAWWHACPLVLYADLDQRTRFACLRPGAQSMPFLMRRRMRGCRDSDRRAGLGILERIAQQVDQDLPHAVLISPHRKVGSCMDDDWPRLSPSFVLQAFVLQAFMLQA